MSDYFIFIFLIYVIVIFKRFSGATTFSITTLHISRICKAQLNILKLSGTVMLSVIAASDVMLNA